jgi:hypothetical protein
MTAPPGTATWYDPVSALTVNDNLSFANCWLAQGSAIISAPPIIATPTLNANFHGFLDMNPSPGVFLLLELFVMLLRFRLFCLVAADVYFSGFHSRQAVKI